MRRDRFEQHFRRATEQARDFARQFVEERLPDAMVFRVHLNASYDAHATPELKRFPEDSSEARGLAMKGLSSDDVVRALWRDGWVPEWIDVGVVGETETATVLDVTACGRFTDDEERLYYTWTDVAPFGVKGPTLPFDFVEGRRFSIHERSSCWSLDDLERARLHAAKVWSLELHGPAFDDAALATLSPFPRLELLEISGAPVDGSGLHGLSRLPRLRHLRARLGEVEALSLRELPAMAALESLTLTSLPPTLEGAGRLGEAAPCLRALTLGSCTVPRTDGPVICPTVEELDITLPTIPSWVAISPSLRWLRLHASDASDEDVRGILAACPAEMDSLGLRGTPVSDRLIEDLERFSKLAYLDAVGTRMTEGALGRFAERRGPRFRCRPSPPELR